MPPVRQHKTPRFFGTVFSCDVERNREMHIPTERMARPTHMSAAGVSLEVNAEMVRLSSQEFRCISCYYFCCCCRENPDLSHKLWCVCTEAGFLLCRRVHHRGNTKPEHGWPAPLKTQWSVWWRFNSALRRKGVTASPVNVESQRWQMSSQPDEWWTTLYAWIHTELNN